MKTTVIIPNYNGIKYLKDCLDALCANMNEEFSFDITVVDNGSEDGSAEMIREGYPAVKIIELNENTGFAAAVNRGIEACDTDYVLLLNNDVNVREDFVKKLEDYIDSDDKLFSVNSVMMSMADNTVLDGGGDYYCALGWAYAYKKGKPTSEVIATGDRKIFSACGGASIFRKSVLSKIGMFDEEHFAYLEDVDLGYRARLAGYKSMLYTGALCEHAGSGFSGSRYNDFKISLSSRNSIYLIFKNMPLLQIIINLPFLLAGFGIKIMFFAAKGYLKTYVKGLGEGFKLSFSKKGRLHRVKFNPKNAGHYIVVQLELWINIIRRLFA